MSSGILEGFYCYPDEGICEVGEEERRLRHRLESMAIEYKVLRVKANGDCSLNLSGTRIADLSPIRELPLTHLCLQGCFEITDFSPLGEMDLVWLNLSRTNITELSSLERLPLSYLRLWRTRVIDISPLVRAPLQCLDIRFSKVTDLFPLKNMPLRELFFFPSRIGKGLHILRDIRTLKRINRGPAREF